MATPFFRGNYGSALSRVDTRPIIEAGRARGQMFAGLGKEVGGMIKEYGLNKQKRQVLTDKIEGTLNLYPEYAAQLTSSGDETSDKKNQTTLDKLAKGELGLSGLQGLAEKLSMMELKDEKERKLQLEDLNRTLTEENFQIKRDALQRDEDLRNSVKTQARQSLGLIKEAKEARQQKMESGMPFKPTLEVERLFAQEDNLKLASETGDVRFLPKPTDPMVSKAAEQNLAKNALEILRLNDELNNSTDELERELLQERIENLRANTAKELADAGFLKRQDEQIQLAIRAAGAPTESAGEPVVQLDDIDEAAQGDLAGVLKNLVNKFTEFFAGGSFYEENMEARAQVEVLNQQLRPAFVKALSDKGSVYTQQEINKILPQTSDSNSVMRAKMKALPALLRRQVEADRKLIATGMGTQTQRAIAFSNLQKLPAIAASLEQIILRDITQGKEFSDEEIDALNKKLSR